MLKTRLKKARELAPDLRDALNQAASRQATAILTYTIQSEVCAGWGYLKLHQKLKQEALEEMHHLHELIERLIFFDEIPKIELDDIRIGANVKEMLQHNLRLEDQAIDDYNEAAHFARENKDGGTEQLVDRLLKDEEQHYDWLTAQLDVIKDVGLPRYLAQQTRPEHDED